MDNRYCSKAACLVLGLILSLQGAAEEHKKAPAAAASPAAAAPAAKPPVAQAPASRPVPEVAPPAPATKPPLTHVPASRPVPDADAPQRPHSKPAPQRIAMAPSAARAANVAKALDHIAATPVAAAAPAPHTLHWSYEGTTGPDAWARLAPEFAKCASGERQSPIDVRDGMKLDLDPVAFEYQPSRFKVVDNGHTIQANVGGWNSMQVMGRRFRLVQFHFHRPSEERINGKLFEMVVHLVHKDSQGRLAVVAVLIETGTRQPVIQAVLNNLPLEKGEEISAPTELDLTDLLPQDRRYFTYMGSLTTPPCTEDVLWIIMKKPVQATADQLNLFSRMYPMNARPIQASSGRTIKESN